MTREAVTSKTPESDRSVFTVCGHWTDAPVMIGDVQSQSGGAWFTHYACAEHAHKYPQLAQWDELPVMRRTPQR
ncbi:hypothetical protein OG393_05595 [Streptomyces sp. NBC_01216]|uniref:hypothetical protein n=1 Tax=Streptomyces sp. NBC_01216 TaxID=2903778 RepID=UPI002E12DB5E|nr:hypothetical protein OG393_05595 [Streptomyces sp. NBC_01216]